MGNPETAEEIKAKSKRQFIFDWLPFLTIVTGLLLNWGEIDTHAVVVYLGFASYGVLGLVELFNTKNKLKHLWRIIKMVTLGVIAIIGIISMLGNPTHFVAMLALLLLDRIILTPSRIEEEPNESH